MLRIFKVRSENLISTIMHISAVLTKRRVGEREGKGAKSVCDMNPSEWTNYK